MLVCYTGKMTSQQKWIILNEIKNILSDVDVHAKRFLSAKKVWSASILQIKSKLTAQSQHDLNQVDNLYQQVVTLVQASVQEANKTPKEVYLIEKIQRLTQQIPLASKPAFKG